MTLIKAKEIEVDSCIGCALSREDGRALQSREDKRECDELHASGDCSKGNGVVFIEDTTEGRARYVRILLAHTLGKAA